VQDAEKTKYQHGVVKISFANGTPQ
jgi:hypothetical protein